MKLWENVFDAWKKPKDPERLMECSISRKVEYVYCCNRQRRDIELAPTVFFFFYFCFWHRHQHQPQWKEFYHHFCSRFFFSRDIFHFLHKYCKNHFSNHNQYIHFLSYLFFFLHQCIIYQSCIRIGWVINS